MSYTHTSLSITHDLDVIGKYNLLIAAVSDGNSLYTRAREVIRALKDDNLLTNKDEGTIIAQTIAQLSSSAMSISISNALQWSQAEKDNLFKIEEMEYKIDQYKLEAAKTEYDRDIAQANKVYLQAKTIREMGSPTLVNGDVASLPADGSAFYQTEGIKKENEIKAKQVTQIDSQITQLNAQIHKLVADTYVNHGMFTGYTVAPTGITGAAKIADSYVTLSDMNRRVAAEQAKGYALNAYGTAASSSAGMIGTLISAEVPNLDMTPYLTVWKTSIDKLNQAVLPSFSQSALSL